jgi:MFS family permease
MTTTFLRITSPRQARIAITVFFFISGFGYSSWASRIPSIKQQLNLNEAQLGAILFALPVGLLFTMPITGRLLTLYNSRKIMLAGAILFNLVLMLPGFSNSIWQLVFILVCFGGTRNLLNLSMNALSVEVQNMYNKSIIASFHGIWSLAGFAGAGVGYLMVTYDVATSYHLLAVSITMIFLTILFYSNTPDQIPVAQKAKPLFSLPEKPLIKFSIISFATMSCENTMYDWSGIYFQNEVHGSKSAATAAFAVYMVFMTLGRFTGDKLVEYLGIKTILKFSGILIFTGLFIAVAFPYPVPVYAGFAVVGLGVSCIVPMVFSIAGKSKTMNSGQALASISTVGYLGFLMVPPLVGFVAQSTSLRWSFGMIALLGGVIVWMVSKLDRD